MSIKTSIQALGLRKAYDYIDKDPKVRLPQAVSILEKFVPSGSAMDAPLNGVKAMLADPDNPWNCFVMSLWEDIDEDVRRAVFENFVINGAFLESEIHDQLEAEHGCNIPWTMLIDPTSACNLRCTGCWAAEYGNRLNLTYEELDSIIGQGKELGMHFFLFSGGEPLVRKADILRLCEKHSDCQFSAFTNGTLIDEAFAGDMLRVKNFIPAISVEGFEADTDFRRGEGTFRKVEKAMAILKQKRLPFGISCCYTSKNVEMIGSEAYFDQMIAWGAKFCWFFTYMPVGNAAVPELMVTP
ncbi:MAG: radical SAM protein, partial [Aristaeellaceae bacterium]